MDSTHSDGNRDDTLVLHWDALAAFYDPTDDAHERCSRLLLAHPGPVVVPCECTSPADVRLRQRAQGSVTPRLADAGLLGNPRPLRRVALEDPDLLRMEELEYAYDLDHAGAATVAIAERLHACAVVALDPTVTTAFGRGGSST